MNFLRFNEYSRNQPLKLKRARIRTQSLTNGNVGETGQVPNALYGKAEV